MKKVPIKATSGSQKAGTLKEVTGTTDQYDSVGEAIKVLKEEGVLNLINRQIKTDSLNALRKPATDPTLKLVKAALSNEKIAPEIKASLEALLKKYNIKLE